MPITISKDVIVLGGGFAGVAAAQHLADKGTEVLLIDKNNYHQFQPLHYQIANAQIGVSEVARPLRAIFRRHPEVRVLVSEVASIDPVAKTVTLADGRVCQAKILVVAVGAEANFFGIPGAEEHTYPMYTLDDALQLGAQMVTELDHADAEATLDTRPPLDLVVVGGGATGVELAGAVADNLGSVVTKMFSADFARSTKVHLVDMAPTVLGPFSEKSQQYARDHLTELGIELRLGVGVTEVTPDGVTLADGSKIPATIIVWAGGLKASRLISESGMPQGKGGRVDVHYDLTVPGFPGVYVLGDSANITDKKGRALPQLGSVAQQSGKWAAHNIHADLAGEAREPFPYVDKGIMAMIGRGAAVAEVGPNRRQIQGPLAFLAWLVVHVALLSGVWQRVGALASWAVSYATPNRPQVVVTSDTGAPPPQ